MVIFLDHRKKIRNFNQFIEEFAPILVNPEKNNKDVILAGDFNIDLLKINEKILLVNILICLQAIVFTIK